MNEAALFFWGSVITASIIIVGWGVNEHFRRNAAKRQKLWELKLEKFQRVNRVVGLLHSILQMRAAKKIQLKNQKGIDAGFLGGYFYFLSALHLRTLREHEEDVLDTFKSESFVKDLRRFPEQTMEKIELEYDRLYRDFLPRLIAESDELSLILETPEVKSCMNMIVMLFDDWDKDTFDSQLPDLVLMSQKLSSTLISAMRDELDRTLQLGFFYRRKRHDRWHDFVGYVAKMPR